MEKIKFINYPKCSTCVKARKWLEEKNINFNDIDIILNTPSEKELKNYFERSNKEIKKFFNTSGMVYREMGLKDKISKMTNDECIKLLSSNGMLIKRPLVIAKKGVLIGFKESEWTEFFKK